MKAIRRRLTPSPASYGCLVIAAGVIGIGVVMGLFFAASESDGWRGFVSRFGFMLGWLAVPVATLPVLIAAWREPGGLARAALWGGAAMLVIVGGLVGTLGLALETREWTAGTVGFAVLCLPPALVLGAVAAYFANRAWPQVSAEMRAEREARLLEIMAAHGAAPLGELARELDLPPSQIDDLVEGLIHQGRLAARLDTEHGWVYSAATLAAKQKQMLGAVTARGQISFEALANELNVPRAWLREWIYQAVKRGEFTGYLNWNEGQLYSAEAEKLRADSRCPRCGGELGLAGQGIIQCAHCGSEIFI